MDLPLSVYSDDNRKAPFVHESYLFQFLDPETRDQLTRLPAKENDKLEFRQRSLNDEIVEFTKRKVQEFKQYAEHLLVQNEKVLAAGPLNSNIQSSSSSAAAAEAFATINSTENKDEAEQKKARSNSIDVEQPSPRSSQESLNSKPLKSSLRSSDTEIDTSADSASGRAKSPKRVAFADKDEVSIVPSEEDMEEFISKNTTPTPTNKKNTTTSDGENHDDEPETPDENDIYLLGGKIYMEPDEMEEELNSLSVSGILPDEIKFIDERREHVPKYNEDGNEREEKEEEEENEEMFAFDEEERAADGDNVQQESSPPNDVKVDHKEAENEYKKIDPTLTDKLLSPEIGSSLPKAVPFELGGSFRPRATSKYLQDHDEDYVSYIPPAASAANNNIQHQNSTGEESNPQGQQHTETSPYASSVPISINQPQGSSSTARRTSKPLLQQEQEEDPLKPMRASESQQTVQNHSRPWNLIEESNNSRQLLHADNTAGIMNTDYTEATAAFGSLANGADVNPARMSFSERMRWEQENSSRY